MNQNLEKNSDTIFDEQYFHKKILDLSFTKKFNGRKELSIETIETKAPQLA